MPLRWPQEFTSLLATQFPNCLEERIPPGEPFPSYFVDSEAVVNEDLPETERSAATMELERLSVFARSSPTLPTCSGSECGMSYSPPSASSGRPGADVVQEHLSDKEDEELEELSLRSWVVVQDLVGAPSLNGAHGIIDQFQAEKGRYVVEFANGSRKLIHAKNLRKLQEQGPAAKQAVLKEGDLAVINGLKNAQQLNGQFCKVKWPKDADRYEVQLVDGTMKAVKLSNLTALPTPGSLVTASNVEHVKVVQRGSGWMWGEQDGGARCLGHIREFDKETGWATVRWNSGRTNKYRVEVDGKHDLQCADPFKHEVECLEALAKGGSAIRNWHLRRTFAYACGVKSPHLEYFDIRKEVCEALGGHKHGQRVQTPVGKQAVTIGVAPLNEELDRPKLFYHVDGSAGAGIFDGLDTRKLKVVGRQKVRELTAERPIDNFELYSVRKEVSPTFQYLNAANSYMAAELERFDIRDSICLKVGGFKHGQVVTHPGVTTATKLGVVIGVRLIDDVPKLFFHWDGRPGAGTFENLDGLQLQVVGSRTVQEAPNDFLDEPELAPEIRELTKDLQLTFSFPMGLHFLKPGLFDIRDEVCLGVGGFRHGQVIEDEDGDHAVVVGVRPDGSVPKLWFKCGEHEGAGLYSKYHLVRNQFKLVGTRKLHEVSPSDPVFQNQGKKKSMMEKLLKGFSGLFESEQEGKLGSDFEFDYTFRYLEKSCCPGLFDIRDEVCMPIGGYKHGDLVRCGGHTMVVIGVRPDTSGTARLWMHVDGSPGAGVFEHQQLIRMAGTVIGKRKVEEYKDPVSACFSPEFIQNLQPSFPYPIGVRGQTRLAMFDIRDEVCLLVSGCKHGERLKYKKLEMIGIGVVMDDGAPEMFLHVVKPKRSPGAGKFERLKIMRPFMKSLGQEVVPEASGDVLPACPMPSMSSSSSEDGFDMCASSEDSEVSQDEGQPARSGVMPSRASEPDEGQVAGHAVLLSLSHTGAKVKDVLLHSEDLADCRQDVLDAGCEVTPAWANGAVLLMPLTQVQAEETPLDLRPHHIVALNGDKDRILAALQTLPCRSRPKIRNETGLPKPQPKQVPDWKEGVDLILTVDRTFLTCVPAAPSEASALESAPCGDMNSAQPVNPRKRGN